MSRSQAHRRLHILRFSKRWRKSLLIIECIIKAIWDCNHMNPYWRLEPGPSSSNNIGHFFFFFRNVSSLTPQSLEDRLFPYIVIYNTAGLWSIRQAMHRRNAMEDRWWDSSCTAPFTMTLQSCVLVFSAGMNLNKFKWVNKLKFLVDSRSMHFCKFRRQHNKTLTYSPTHWYRRLLSILG